MILIHALSDGSVAVTQPGPARPGEPEPAWLDRVSRKCCPKGAKLVAVVSADDLPSRMHRNAWVWDGQRVVVDEARIKPKPSVQPAPAGASPAYDPRVDTIGQQLSEQMAAVVAQMQADFERRLAAINESAQREVVIEVQRQLEALMVTDAVARDVPVVPGHFPALERMVREQGQPVTSDTIIAAADRQKRRGIQIAAGTP